MIYQKKGTKNFDHLCEDCKKKFKGTRNQRRCSECILERRFPKRKPKGLISNGTTGAIQELKVSIDLMQKGFHVFRALSPSTFCDLFAFKDGNQFDIEVRTATRHSPIGKLSYPKKGIKAKYLALVIENEIIYDPPFIIQ